MSYLRQCHFCNLMFTFLKCDCTDDVFILQMWPPEDAVSEMRHSYCLYEWAIDAVTQLICSKPQINSVTNHCCVCCCFDWNFFICKTQCITDVKLSPKLLYKINITFVVMQIFGINSTHAGVILVNYIIWYKYEGKKKNSHSYILIFRFICAF